MADDSRRAYRRLPGSGSGNANPVVAAKHRLYLADDHLLSVTTHYFSEVYRRFYFHEIRSLVVVKTSAWLVVAGILGAVAVVAGALALAGIAFSWATWGTTTLVVFSAAFLLLAAAEIARGPSCRTYIQTAVQREQLHCLSRQRRAARALRYLRPLIEEAQDGALTDDMLDSGWARAAEPPDPGAHTTAGTQGGRTLRYYHGAAHAVLYSALLGDALVACSRFAFQSRLQLPVEGVFTIAMVIAVVVALIKQHGTTMGRALRFTPWLTAIYLGVLSFVGVVHQTAYAVQHPEVAANSWELMQTMSMMPPGESAAVFAITLVSALTSGLLAVGGFRLLVAYRNQAASPGPDVDHDTGEAA
jgi:hypothetical protein